MRGKAQAFIDSGKKWDIDPRILLAVAMQESARGTKTRGKNSVGGPKQNFNSIEESIDHIAQRIDTIRTKQHRKKNYSRFNCLWIHKCKSFRSNME